MAKSAEVDPFLIDDILFTSPQHLVCTEQINRSPIRVTAFAGVSFHLVFEYFPVHLSFVVHISFPPMLCVDT